MTVPAHTGKTVLVIEDDKEMNASLQRKLRKHGYDTEGCFDGEQALLLLDRKPFDAITLDLLMPVQDGFAVLAKKHGTRNAETPAYVLTTLGDEKIELARQLGAALILNKAQVSPADVAEIISKKLSH